MSAPKIDIMIIGAQKSGSSSLKTYLSAHRDIVTHYPKEFDLLSNDINELNRSSFSKYYGENIEFNSKILAKCASMYYNESGLINLKKHNPNCKIIFILRDPVHRAYSSYKMEHYAGWVKEDFNKIVQINLLPALNGSNETLDGINKSYFRIFIELGNYSNHLNTIHKHFSPNQVKVILFENVIRDKNAVLRDIINWLNLDSDNRLYKELHTVHNKSYRPYSERITKLLHNLRRKDNILKIISKKIIPYKHFISLSDFLDSLNKTNYVYPELESKTVEILKDYYKSQNIELSKKLNDLELNW